MSSQEITPQERDSDDVTMAYEKPTIIESFDESDFLSDPVLAHCSEIH